MTREKVEETRKKIWQIIGDVIEGKAIEYGLKELDVFLTLSILLNYYIQKAALYLILFLLVI